MPKLKRGSTVMIYKKPITREDYEGMGLLDTYLSTSPINGYERWTVWIGKDEVTRTINPNHYVQWLMDCKQD